MATKTPDLSDFVRGDPARHVLGLDDEKPARRHGRQKPKPALGERGIKALILYRMGELEPILAEYKELKEAQKALKGI